MNTTHEQLTIPIYDPTNIPDDLYEVFYEHTGCFILKNVYSTELMDEYNSWCAKQKQNVLDTHKNTHHPKQKDKFVINDVAERMSIDNPKLLMTFINNPIIDKVSDILLGFARYGAITTHWLEAGGDRQLSHTDYPCHIGSGKFWKNDYKLIDKYFTPHQQNQFLPYYSFQTLIASDSMDASNGSTECIPGTNTIEFGDKKMYTPGFYDDKLNSMFINSKLDKGDCLFFNRRLIHRGGKNISDSKRNSLIIQKVWSFGLGQHKFDHELILDNLSKAQCFDTLTEDEIDDIRQRLSQPYPIDTTICN